MSAVFRGRTEARALLLATALIGEAEARARVLALWRPGTTVHRLPGGDWLVTLPEPLSVRAEHAPGLPLTGPEVPQDGEPRRYDTGALPAVDPADWLDLSAFAVAPLTPLQPPAPPPTPVAEPEPAADPDIRSAARVGEPDARMLRLLEQEAPGAGAEQGPLLRLLAASPALGWLLDRQRRYLDRLTTLFEGRSWEDALRSAVPLGGPAGGRVSLGLPGQRLGPLRPTPVRGPAGGSMPYQEGLYDKLARLYREAAEALERQGRVDEAAFVLADLLDDAPAAVALLERHGRLRLAAELAEGRRLAPELVVRLWWRAGDRGRALRVARLRGAFAAAVTRLERTDPEAAAALRQAWSADRYAAGDTAGAIEAAWPAEELRAGAVSLARQGLDTDAAHRPLLLAYALARTPDPAHAAEARALLAGRHPDEAEWHDQRAFLRTLAALDPQDRALDAELCSAGLRAVLRAAAHETDADARSALIRRLRGRADPLLSADLAPAPPLPERTVPRFAAERRPGGLPLRDAVALSRTTVLTAHGELGVRLLGRDGRIRAAWDVPAHRLITADHGGAALLATHRGEVTDLHRLDLATRRVRHWAALRVTALPTSYDGGVLAVADEDGLAFLETRAAPPRALWRELDRDHTVLRLARTPEVLSAAVLVPPAFGDGAPVPQIWVWELPGLTLRARADLPAPPLNLLAGGQTLTVDRSQSGARLVAAGRDGTTLGPLPAHTRAFLTDGDTLALELDEESALSVTLVHRRGVTPWAGVSFPPGGEVQRVRVHGELVTVYDEEGRIVVVDAASRTQVLSLRTPQV
ncbi:bpX6 domain-containing protein [Streptomyces sp. NPDC051940]|uniref:bpX6 domain-containing protein n=1 Tax=Streptomyces sp. NPDC051940 TaxID=3155675 RepID=UPI003443B8BD